MIRARLRAFLASMRIGWAIESNWTNPFLYILYAAIRPLALCVLLFFLFKVVSASPAENPKFVAVFIGNAFFTVFGTMAGSLSWAIISDREHYQLIRYVYIAPTPFVWTIVGRAVTFLMVAVSSVALILAIGHFWLHIPVGVAHIDWGLLVPVSLLGLTATLGLGIFFAGMLLVTARHSLLLAEGVGGTVLLICGVLYPTTFLPKWLQPLALVSPITHWIEGSRRAFGLSGFDTNLAWIPDWMLLAILAALTVPTVWGSFRAFKWFEYQAKMRGKIDQVTNY